MTETGTTGVETAGTRAEVAVAEEAAVEVVVAAAAAAGEEVSETVMT